MTPRFLTEQREGGIVVLTMDGPDDRNALSRPDQCQAFVDACARMNADETVKVAVLTGAGPAFCSGGNVKHMRSHEGFMAGSPVEVAEGYRRSLQQVAVALFGLEVPMIAAVNGPAMGAGLDIACMCDIRIASVRAKFAETFVRLGIISGIGGTWFLPRVVGYPMAAELSFTGRVIDAVQARACGLVSEVVPAEELMSRALSLAEEMARNSGVALRFCKRLLRISERNDLRSSLDATAAYQALAHQTAEHRQAVETYLGAQKPRA